jgi:hypothetical protein
LVNWARYFLFIFSHFLGTLLHIIS